MFRYTILGLVLAFAMSAARAADEKKPSKEDEAAIQAVQERLRELKAENVLRLQPVGGEALERVFPGRRFVLGFVPTFPVARALPEGSKVKGHNLFVVKDGKVQKQLTDSKQLGTFFEESLPAARKDEELKDAARAWLLLSQSFLQDGFYKFTLSEDSLKVTPGEKNTRKVTGQLVVTAGGNGTVTATLTFDETGKLSGMAESSKLRPGPRPICQATRLLDADPIVRKMAEQDLLIMGRAARPYLLEQRGKASPELQKAIDRIWQRILKVTDE